MTTKQTAPYVYEFKANTKKRWVGARVLDVVASEFRRRTRLYFGKAIEAGAIKVNGARVDPQYRLQDGDLLTHLVHRHEPPIPTDRMEVIYEDELLLAIDKPSGIPCHPNSAYTKHTVTEIVKKQRGLEFASVVNRLDRQTSGVVVLAKTPEAAAVYHKKIEERRVHKWYIARVRGVFPKDPIRVDIPLHIIPGECLTVVSRGPGGAFVGKESCTEFWRVSVEGGESTVLCRPLTGRTHQIRVHLQFLGFPISNDAVYSSAYPGVTISELLLQASVESGHKVISGDSPGLPMDVGVAARPSRADVDEDEVDSEDGLSTIDTCADVDDFIIKACNHCRRGERPGALPRFSTLFLHAYAYRIDGTSIVARVPGWADTEVEKFNEIIL